MSRKYKFHNPEGIYFVSFAVQNWIYALTRVEYKNIIVESLRFCQRHKGLKIYAWVIMTNHVHLVISSEGQLTLSEILRDFKRHTSKHIIKAIQDNPEENRKEWMLRQFSTEKGWRFWRGDNQPIELWSNSVIDQKINYVHMNPVKAGLAFVPEDYMYSSAVNYAGEKGLLDVEVVL
ncbi:transposase [Saccharicrinis sp. FJH54]|uniref:REP-associated tyrosine transposase n=1 Tax=Saccharicrinis sp. FJH54 TaxID=3344665 RepID=UPI0035D46B1E